MADTKRPLEAKEHPQAIADALAGTLEPPVHHPRNRTKRQKVQGNNSITTCSRSA
ncbi:hypothetical protein BGZ94_003195 [Podila epigama]|nr:hypothetical protein BGZ94_003195 [Podila epigama]